MAATLDSPSFIKILLDNPNSIFIVEDAEELLVSRVGSRNSCVAMLLNITDGILGEGLGIQVIATFNTSLINIDKALLRKGRLLSIYEFKALETDKAKKLLHKFGKNYENIQEPMILADIYNFDENETLAVIPKKKTIGFLSNVD